MMLMPPTPPDDNSENHRTGYVTPNASNTLTPEGTPPAVKSTKYHMDNIARSHKLVRSHDQRNLSPTWHGRDAIAGASSSDEVELSSEDNEHIPVKGDEHLQGRDPLDSPEQSPVALPLRIHRKRKNISTGDATTSTTPTKSTTAATRADDPHTTPSDVAMNDHLYSQLRRNKMDRLDALQDGSTIEAVVLSPESARTPSLRHVKKRHSLRNDSQSTFAISNDDVPKNARDARSSSAERPQTLPLKHKKAFEPSRQLGALTIPADSGSNPSASSVPTLRHERRPLSAGGRQQTSTQLAHEATLALAPLRSELRHSSAPNPINRLSAESHNLRRASKDSRLENLKHVHNDDPADLGSPRLFEPATIPNSSGLSPSIKSHRFANTQTPMSAISDRTEMELCMAKNVTLFPHSNDSVVLINNDNPVKKQLYVAPQLAPRTFRPLSFTFEDPESSSSSSTGSMTRTLSTPEIQINGNQQGFNSPLTNPRAAPLPPQIQFTAPTPSVDGERQAYVEDAQPDVQRSDSLMKKARRLSGSLLTPLFRSASQRQRTPQESTATNDKLHPMWTPNYMWDDDDDYSDQDEYVDERDYLPPGGDTSDHPVQQRGLFPRQMSVRMPGFRGNGGFLLGNSLGVERHGTNRRRHYIDMPTKSKPVVGNTWLKSMKQRIHGRRAAREEAARERRRADLKDRIVHNV